MALGDLLAFDWLRDTSRQRKSKQLALPSSAPRAPYVQVPKPQIPVVVPSFNNLTYCMKMIAQLQAMGAGRIIIFDNGSSYAPMLKFLARPPKGVETYAAGKNLGPFHVILDPLCLALLPDIFCLTDPDLEFNPQMPADFIENLAALTKHYRIGKAGLALDISDRHLMHQREFQMATGSFTIWDWEKQFWKKRVGTTAQGDPVYRAPIDTTFAVYNKAFYRPEAYWKALRVAGRYTCRHLPWYQDNGLPAEEESFYRARSTRSYYLSDNKALVDARA